MKKWTPWLVSAAMLGAVVYLVVFRRDRNARPNLVAGGGFASGPGALSLSDQVDMGLLGANPNLGVTQAINRATTLADAVTRQPSLAPFLGLTADQMAALRATAIRPI